MEIDNVFICTRCNYDCELHSADRKVYEIASLKEEVKELRSAFVEGRKQLMELKKESSIIRKLTGNGLAPSEVPPKKIKVKSHK